MSNLLEIVFEGVAKSSVIPLLMQIINDPKNICSIDCSENISFATKNIFDPQFLNAVLEHDGDICLFLHLESLGINMEILPLVLLRIIKYGYQYDIDFSFDINKTEKTDMASLIKNLFSYASKLANDFVVVNYYGGMEPASDTNTRYFTNDKLGPLLP
jgi:hypothetical protein